MAPQLLQSLVDGKNLSARTMVRPASAAFSSMSRMRMPQPASWMDLARRVRPSPVMHRVSRPITWFRQQASWPVCGGGPTVFPAPSGTGRDLVPGFLPVCGSLLPRASSFCALDSFRSFFFRCRGFPPSAGAVIEGHYRQVVQPQVDAITCAPVLAHNVRAPPPRRTRSSGRRVRGPRSGWRPPPDHARGEVHPTDPRQPYLPWLRSSAPTSSPSR